MSSRTRGSNTRLKKRCAIFSVRLDVKMRVAAYMAAALHFSGSKSQLFNYFLKNNLERIANWHLQQLGLVNLCYRISEEYFYHKANSRRVSKDEMYNTSREREMTETAYWLCTISVPNSADWESVWRLWAVSHFDTAEEQQTGLGTWKAPSGPSLWISYLQICNHSFVSTILN